MKKTEVITKVDNQRITSAIKIAAEAHQDQYRKSTDIPYIFHPFEAAMELAYGGHSQELVIAALFHDLLEDTDIGQEQIQHEFGDEVLRLVLGATEKELQDRDSKTWRQRKEHTLQYLKYEADRDILLVSCADKLSNVRSIYRDYQSIGDKVWERFNEKDKKSHKWYYDGLADSLSRLAGEKIYIEFTELVKKVFQD